MTFFKKTIIAFSLFLLASLCFAIPGVTPLISDSSGEFVYYRDHSFSRESYIGLIFYDEATYGVRYFAPADSKKRLPALSFLVLVTIDSEKIGAVEFTGEKVEPLPRSEEETAIINYLHDFLYELFPRRERAGDIFETTEITGDYEQFGGRVKFVYDPLVPVLNLRSISTIDGKIALELVTEGKLRSAQDASFNSFSGIPQKAKKTQNLKINKKLSKQTQKIDCDTFEFSLDSQWEQKSPLVWMISSVAMVTASQVTVPEEMENRLLRMLRLGSDCSYPVFASLNVEKKGERTVVSQRFFDSETGEFQIDKKILAKRADGSTVIFSLTSEESAYSKNKAYFDSIVNSFLVIE